MDPLRPPHEGRTLAEEVPVALVYHGSTQAVMMATPQDLEDFAVGFSLTEGIVEREGDIEDLEAVDHGEGIELRMWLSGDRAAHLSERRRLAAGPVGCGLCGIESISSALRTPPGIETATLRIPRPPLAGLADALRDSQPLHDATGAVHAAGLWRPGEGVVVVREDVGRHNALDKLAGAMARAGKQGAGSAIVLTSRVSVEMVQKACAVGAEAILSVSAPTERAVRMAQAAGLTLVCNLKSGPRCLAHPQRIDG
ncbi:formate dehydrogenase accessory sulfurtransferase FdhD [Roseicyclus sp. F158]|uniref:Sulfur carrier protein FdhD n=1 Tax=Tropicimonas omnivorans TaxID=3075590 RepID=A0ABU3DFL6_9RHOB|nr:formate dehydrogenase accessory sulfurtransferase FdhD [Roseicyclus sp. F158]MDT0682501.1 formate dehydrogenase accessory sulfurtransferase FdhD [Roseicyclus sp. F158]